jgi:signal peptidase I
MRSRSPAQIATIGAVLVLVVVSWINFGPRQLGGSVSYVITHGVSMEPRIHEGDLVVLREAPSYGRGDVIAYYSPTIGQPVMHRIFRGSPQGWTTKGDNNDWLDSDRPTDADVLGKEWIVLPGAGKVLRRLMAPPIAATLVALVGLGMFAGTKGRKRRDKGKGAMGRSLPPLLQQMSLRERVVFCVAGLVTLASLVLSVMSFTTAPSSTNVGRSTYSHHGLFEYSADATKDGAYADGSAATGEPLFLNVIDSIDVSFAYNLETEEPAEVAGGASLWLRVSNDSGWERGYWLQERTEFTGPEVKVSGTVDPDKIESFVTDVESATGIAGGTYTVSLVPVVAVEGLVAGQGFDERFKPELAFAFTGPLLQVLGTGADAEAAAVADPLNPVQEGSLQTSTIITNTIGFAGMKLEVGAARIFALLGVLLGGLLMIFMWDRASTREPAGGEVAAIATKYRAHLIDVLPSPSSQAPGRVVRVASIEDLARLAERFDRMILHEDNNGAHRYLVEESAIEYEYHPAGQPAAATPPTPAPKPVAKPQAVKPVAKPQAAKPPEPAPQPKLARATVAKTPKPGTNGARTNGTRTVKPLARLEEPKAATTKKTTTARKKTTKRPSE